MGDADASTRPFDPSFFTLETGTWMTGQHAAMVASDGSILLYDNRNESDGESLNSRAVKYALDETAMTADQAWEAIAPKYTKSLGDVDELSNNNVLICAGGPAGRQENSSSSTAHIIEVSGDETAETVWELTVDGSVYRAERIGWTDFL